MNQHYTPTSRFTNTNGLYGNHFRFTLQALPDLTYFAQSVQVPALTIPTTKRGTPFTQIAEVGDHIQYGPITVSYQIDAQFKTYQSLYWWLKGYGFPHSYDEVRDFRELRAKNLPQPRAMTKDIEKTTAVLHILQPDTEKPLVEFVFTDVFPTSLSELQFTTTADDATQLFTIATFEFTEFELVVPS